jgi:hypothetical protein
VRATLFSRYSDPAAQAMLEEAEKPAHAGDLVQIQ